MAISADGLVHVGCARAMWQAALVLALLALLEPPSAAALQCLNENGNPVDWYYMMKIPGKEDQCPCYYAYSDPVTPLMRSAHDLGDGDGALGSTLKQVYNGAADSFAYAFYNDMSPDGKLHDSRAHSKGAMGFDAQSGFWLVHSVPAFPPYLKDGYAGFGKYASTHYGQSFLCLSLNTTAFQTVGTLMSVNYPYVHDSGVPDAIASAVPAFAAWLQGNHTTAAVATQAPLSTLGGNTFTAFAKTKYWGKELYEDLVAPAFKTGLKAETWQRQDKLPSFCKPDYGYDVENIQEVKVPSSTAAFAAGSNGSHNATSPNNHAVGHTGNSWKTTDDHSKWAVGIEGGAQVGCIGDINRMSSQEKRGGGTVCAVDSKWWGELHGMAQTTDSCDGAAADP